MSLLRFDGRVVIVTGGGNGMGRTHCLLLASRGAKVVVNDIGINVDSSGGSAVPANTVAEEIRRAGGDATADTHSVGTEDGPAAIVRTAIETYGRVDAVIHNASMQSYAPIEQMTLAEFRAMQAVNVEGGFLLARSAWPHMVQQKFGRFLMITSLAGLQGLPHLTHYASSKAGLVGLTRVLALEGHSHGIRANALAVAAYTRRTANSFNSGAIAGMERFGAWWRRFMGPELTSPVAAWLIHEECRANGEIYETGGGHVQRIFLTGTQGFAKLELTLEDVRDHFEAINDPANAVELKSSSQTRRRSDLKIVAAGAEPLPE